MKAMCTIALLFEYKSKQKSLIFYTNCHVINHEFFIKTTHPKNVLRTTGLRQCTV